LLPAKLFEVLAYKKIATAIWRRRNMRARDIDILARLILALQKD
jgi:hypothetical protein